MLKYFFIFMVILLLVSVMLKNHRIEYQYVVATGASSNHELSIIQFIYFIQKYNKNIYYLIWDLGFSKWFRKLLKSVLSKNNNMIYLFFNFTEYPSYFNINKNRGEYAWKSLIINISYYKMKRTTLWLDAGCIVLGSLNHVFLDIDKYAVWSVFSCGKIRRWTHIRTVKYYNISNNITEKYTCSGGLVGFKWNSKIANIILKEWVDCSFHKECIAPQGSNRMNHRQDQSSLSILLYKYNIFEKCPFNTYNIRTNRDIHNFTNFKRIFEKLKKNIL